MNWVIEYCQVREQVSTSESVESNFGDWDAAPEAQNVAGSAMKSLRLFFKL